ncbi:putative calcium-binding protein CML21 [Raphanus sativus]|uniref:Probable calcium-binding protein CML21 n=1 Tax=Raphanus sativus TaxID=3726 RepID=A0A6J0N155_RAPSA|nr:probable calcium-binding protein CML21 [Raphanus sativus]XP_018477712.1 probable calcium-binding protein CML21 [Raphanus sativus]XP_056852365.1 probable calcium-binding protein CML21 [Raphanus sativus]XP_056856248.1 probable calcium-binding protein CML21 [Raphanus sativus]XP_056856249.1 probable calcium-binding protein CML21 [Raphanus sativus]XP_056856250.1 probable calcium-binding protein CML21 [Raphanus sativus]XP_056863177.1 probable calcium-binding protein CML21 [Raphanus sativus]XP_0
MGGAVTKSGAQEWVPETKLEAKIKEAVQRRASKGTTMKSFNSIILKFPKIDEGLRNCKAIFQEFDEDSNGSIDHSELKNCFRKLEIMFEEEEINDLFQACDINEDKEIAFTEFIVLLCLVYLLKDDSSTLQKKWRLGMPKLEPTFETLVDTFVFLDENKDGHVSREEMFIAIDESGERSSGRIAMKRFEEMDWDRNGMVNFKEFLFALTQWVGIDENEDDDDDDDDNNDKA